jgi:hypothetical protein
MDQSGATIKKMRLSRISAFAVALLSCAMLAQVPQGGPPEGKQAIAAGKFAEAKTIYEAYLQKNPGSLPGELGLADALLGLHQYEDAELEYRKITAAQPELWIAHKNLVLIEAKLGRWEEFDRERELLRGARQRGAPGISKRESDVIDSIDISAQNGKPAQHWIVREYFEPVGRSQARYNFEWFGTDGRVKEYVSLESADGSVQSEPSAGVLIGSRSNASNERKLALRCYTASANRTIKTYDAEPKYQELRREFLHWARGEAASVRNAKP